MCIIPLLVERDMCGRPDEEEADDLLERDLLFLSSRGRGVDTDPGFMDSERVG